MFQLILIKSQTIRQSERDEECIFIPLKSDWYREQGWSWINNPVDIVKLVWQMLNSQISFQN